MLLEKVIICNFHKIIYEISLALSKSIAGLMKRKNDFMVSHAILLRGGATTTKNCKDLTMKLEVKYLSPTLCLSARFYIYERSEGLGMRKILALGIRMQKKAMRVQSTACNPARKFHQWHY